MNDDLRSLSNGRPMNVLVVDDDDTFHVVMQRRLTASRHQVECVPSGEAALECLSARTFDVVLLDLRMPGLGGLETLKRIREADWPCEVVVLTGQPDYDDCVTAMKSGAFHYLDQRRLRRLAEVVKRPGFHPSDAVVVVGLACEHHHLARPVCLTESVHRPQPADPPH